VSTEPIAGRYELVEPIRSGGMGQVWRGYDSVLDREVAVKLIRADVVATPEQADEFARRFRREARLTARIRHHGVPQVYDAVLDLPYDRVYLVMELVHGRPLRAFIDTDTPLPISWAAAIAAQVATVLSHAHAVPAVHRDLKPDNIMVTADGAIKVLDFGIAAILRTGTTRITATGTPVGTTGYMSPEQIKGGQVSPRSDLYALGCVLHELVTGRHLFDADNEFALMQQHVSGTPMPVRQLRPDAPEPLERLILDLLAKAPEGRPADAYEVYQRLLPLLPPPGADPLPAGAGPEQIPDPTRVYRLPNEPCLREEAVVTVAPAPAAATPPADTALNDVITAAVAGSDALLDDERFSQAADALHQAITPATEALGPENPQVLRLRARRAAILVLGGDYRHALPEFDALADAYGRIAGSTSEQALDCLREAAHCRAELGHTTTALHQFQQVLTHVRAARGDASPTALDLRRTIAILLLADGRPAEAQHMLQPLHEDLILVYGPDHEETQEVADLMARLRLASRAPTDPAPHNE
jgi:tRNA A-37 threonylcarbamoyl transferase component Bud32/tetratricopeptide (TPR) repeat protein